MGFPMLLAYPKAVTKLSLIVIITLTVLSEICRSFLQALRIQVGDASLVDSGPWHVNRGSDGAIALVQQHDENEQHMLSPYAASTIRSVKASLPVTFFHPSLVERGHSPGLDKWEHPNCHSQQERAKLLATHGGDTYPSFVLRNKGNPCHHRLMHPIETVSAAKNVMSEGLDSTTSPHCERRSYQRRLADAYASPAFEDKRDSFPAPRKQKDVLADDGLYEGCLCHLNKGRMSDVSACNVEGVDSGPRCAVCLSEFFNGQAVRQLPFCHHVFHKRCIDGWLDHNQRTCPLCRTCLVRDDAEQTFCCPL